MQQDNGIINTGKQKLILISVICWAVLLLGFSFVFFSERHEQKDSGASPMRLQAGVSFSLQGIHPDSIVVLGHTPVRIESEGAAVLDPRGREQDFISWPYRTARTSFAGEALLVLPVNESGFTLIAPDKSTQTVDTKEQIDQGDYSGRYLATIGHTASSRGIVSVYDLSFREKVLSLTFNDEGWPVAVRMMKNEKGFDLLLADVAEGRPVTRIQQYDLSGSRLMDLKLSGYPLLAGLSLFSPRQRLLFGLRDALLLDAVTGDTLRSMTPGELRHFDEKAGTAALAADGPDAVRILLFRASERGDALVTDVQIQPQTTSAEPRAPRAPGEGPVLRAMALSKDGRLLLTAVDEDLVLYDAGDGQELARQAAGEPVRSILAMDSKSFLVVTDQKAVIMSDR